MRRILFLLVLAVASVANAQVEIVVPDEAIEAQRTYLFQVKGIDEDALKRTTLTVSPKESAMAMGVTGWDGSQYIWFVGQQNGPCCVIVAVGPADPGKPDVAATVLNVGGESPGPDPPPPPDETVWGVILIEETENRTPELAKIVVGTKVSKYLASKGLIWMPRDQDVSDAGGKTPEDLVPYITEAKKEGLPRLFIMGANGHEFYAGDVPKDSDALIALVQKYEGNK